MLVACCSILGILEHLSALLVIEYILYYLYFYCQLKVVLNLIRFNILLLYVCMNVFHKDLNYFSLVWKVAPLWRAFELIPQC